MKEFYIEDDRIRLHAKLELPEGKERCPLVILVHGFTGDMEEPHIVGVGRARVTLRTTRSSNGSPTSCA